MFHSLLVFAAFACLLPYGSPVKCYTCSPKSNTVGCQSPKNLWNVTDCSEEGQRFDRCGIYRLTDAGKVYELRGCYSAAICVHIWFSCQEGNKHSGGKCDLRCCEGDLCNKGELEPPKYKLFKPSGKNLSCYTCSDFPRRAHLDGIYKDPDQPNCTSPVTQMCGGRSLHPYIAEDRCITLKVKAIVSSIGRKVLDWTYRGCSSVFHCSFTEAMWHHTLNGSRSGIRYLSGKSSCCHGNLCDNTTDSDNTDDSSMHSAAITNVNHLSTGLDGFFFFVLITMIKSLID